jgi:dCMP deaminase
MSNEKWDKRFLDLAVLVASWSKDPSTQTGAVIVTADRKGVFIGYNGFPRPMFDMEHLYADREQKYSRIIHCEMNALLQAGPAAEGATLYTWPFASCDRCFVHMAQGGIKRFVAPRLTGERAERWEPSLRKTRMYSVEMGLQLDEIEYEPQVKVDVAGVQENQRAWDKYQASRNIILGGK